jgi:hypothetical protein
MGEQNKNIQKDGLGVNGSIFLLGNFLTSRLSTPTYGRRLRPPLNPGYNIQYAMAMQHHASLDISSQPAALSWLFGVMQHTLMALNGRDVRYSV